MNFSVEKVIEIWNDTGERWEVGHDRDGLGLIEIRSRDHDGKIDARMTFPKNVLSLLVNALLDFEKS